MTENERPSARIAIVEDDPMVRQYFQGIIAMEPGFQILGMAPDIASADALIDQSPDLFLLDIGLPDGLGYDLVPKIKQHAGSKALIISTFGRGPSAWARSYRCSWPLGPTIPTSCCEART